MAATFLFDGPSSADVVVLLAHGAGAPMDSPTLSALAKAIAAHDIQVPRFEFGYMAARRTGGSRPPPRAETLMPEYVAAVEGLKSKGKRVIGGKSLGGRVASMVADELYAKKAIAG